MMIATANACRNPGICKPGIKRPVNITIKVLTTSVNSPKVRMLMGIVSSIKTGRTRMFTTPSTIPAQSRVAGDAYVSPGNNNAVR